MSRKPTETEQGTSDKQDHTNTPRLSEINEGYMQMMQRNGHFDTADMALARSRGRKSSIDAHGLYAVEYDGDLTLSLAEYTGGTTLDLRGAFPVGEELRGLGGWIEHLGTLAAAKR